MSGATVVRGAVRPIGMPGDVPAVPDALAIPGLRFRGIAGRADYARIVAINDAAAEADGIRERHTVEETESWLIHDQHRDIRRDVVLAEVDGQLVGMAFGGWEPDNDGGHDYQVSGAVRPDWRRRGLGTTLLHRVEARQRQVAAAHRPSGEKRLESWASTRETGRLALLEREGYGVVRSWLDMERPDLENIPAVSLPDGFAFTSGPDADPREVWDAVSAGFQDHFGGMDHGEEAYQGFLQNPNRDPALWVLVSHHDRIVGTALNRISTAENAASGVQRGRINAVAVLRDYRRRGLARAIMARSLQVLRDAGMQVATLGVDSQNPHGALGLYESLGFRTVEEGRVYRKPLDA